MMRIYNSLPAENTELQNQILKLMFGSCGDNVRVNQPIRVDCGCNIFLGANSQLYSFRYGQNYDRKQYFDRSRCENLHRCSSHFGR